MNTAEPEVSLAGSAYGGLLKSSERDAFRYDSLAQRQAGPFYTGLLLPGQEVTVETSYRPIVRAESFRVLYAAAHQAYDGTAGSLAPFRVYIRETGNTMVCTYVPFTGERWRQIVSANPTVRPVGPDAGERAAVIEDVPRRPDAKQAVLEFQPEYSTAGFFLEEARERAAEIAGAEPEDLRLVYCEALGGYVVEPEGGGWILTGPDQNARGARLPPLPAVMLRDVDEAGNVKVKVGDEQEGFGPQEHPAGWSLWGKYPVQYGDGMYTRGEFVHIDAAKLREFLAEVHSRGGSLTDWRYYFRYRYYVLEVPQEKGSPMLPDDSFSDRPKDPGSATGAGSSRDL
ncbi:MAG: hypothetical protein R6X33_14105 [Candidatus Brocadiia bacterium]